MADPSLYPFERLRRISRADAALESACARWLAATPKRGDALAQLVGGPVRIDVIGVVAQDREPPKPPPATQVTTRVAPPGMVVPVLAAPSDATRPATPNAVRSGKPSDARTIHSAEIAATMIAGGSLLVEPTSAIAELRLGGVRVVLVGSGGPIRTLAQRLLGGPDELPAPRPLAPAEHAIFALVVATCLEDAAIAGDVIPRPFPDQVPLVGLVPIELAIAMGDLAMTVTALVPDGVTVRMPPPREPAAWTSRVAFDLPIVVGRCALTRSAIAALAVRDTITIDRARELVIGNAAIAIEVSPGAMEARVASGYVPIEMGLPDDAHVELSVTLGTTKQTIRQLAELAVGQIIALGRPLAGPFELRVEGKVIGAGELVDIDGELGVRVVRLGE